MQVHMIHMHVWSFLHMNFEHRWTNTVPFGIGLTAYVMSPVTAVLHVAAGPPGFAIWWWISQFMLKFPNWWLNSRRTMKYPHIFMVKVQFPIWWLNKFNFWTAPEHSNLAPGRTIAMWTSMCPLGVLSAFAVRAVSLVLGHSDVRLSSLAPVQPGGGKILKWTDPRLRSWVFVTRHPGGIIFFPVWSWWKMSCPESWKSAVL